MGSAQSLASALKSQRKIAYLLAVVLPALSTELSLHLDWLQPTPLAPHFISILLVAGLGGIGPALLSYGVTFFFHAFFHRLGYGPHVLTIVDRVRSVVLLVTALIVSAVFHSRRRSERDLTLAHEQLKDRTVNLVDSLHSNKCACWTIDLDSGRSARWYRGSYEVFGRPFDEIEQLPSLVTLLHPDDRPRLGDLVQRMKSNAEPLVFEFRCIWPNGEAHWLEMRGSCISDDLCCWRGITIDITERRNAESALLRSEKLAAMGRLASTVAHEINNPLESVTNLLYLALRDPELSAGTREFLSTAEAELGRLGNITRLTLGYVRGNTQRDAVDIARVADDVLSLFSHRSEMKSAEVDRDYAPGIRVLIASHELRQILTNLIANAADALVKAPTPRLRLQTFVEAHMAVITVADNGAGIDPGQADHIFEPFFSTKGEVGTGIGLWVTRSLVEKNDGTIQLLGGACPHDMRTCFRIEFPLVPPLQQTSSS